MKRKTRDEVIQAMYCYSGVKRVLLGDNELRVIRSVEISQIRDLMSKGFNQAQISRILDLNRISVRRVYNKIIDGEPLKFEQERFKSLLSVGKIKEERIKHWSIK